MLRHLVVQLLAHQPPRLVRPAPGHVGDLVPSSAQNEGRPPVRRDAGDGGRVARRRQVEPAQAVPGQRVRAALEHDRPRVEARDAGVHHGREHRLVALVRDAVPERSVQGKTLAGADADVVERAGAREKAVAVLVEGDGQDSVRRQEGLLDAVAVVDVDVDVEDAGGVFFFFWGGGGLGGKKREIRRRRRRK